MNTKKDLKIATPISHLFEDLDVAEKIISLSDCLEVRERSLESTFDKQFLAHIDVDIQHEWDDKMRDYMKKIIESKPDLRLMTLQITRVCHEYSIKEISYPNYYKIFEMKGKIYSKDEMFYEASKNIDWLKLQLGKDVELAVENNNYLPAESYNIVTDGDFLTEIVNENSIGFLFDLAHAQVTAKNKKISLKNYVSSLPMDRMIQMHICKPLIPDNGIAYDAHEAPDHAMFEDVLDISKKYEGLKYFTVEYYKDHEMLIRSLRQLKRTLSKLKK